MFYLCLFFIFCVLQRFFGSFSLFVDSFCLFVFRASTTTKKQGATTTPKGSGSTGLEGPNSSEILKTSVAKTRQSVFRMLSRHRPADPPSFCDVHISLLILEHIKYQIQNCRIIVLSRILSTHQLIFRRCVTPEIAMLSFSTPRSGSTRYQSSLQCHSRVQQCAQQHKVVHGRSVTLDIAMPSFPVVPEKFNWITQVLFTATAACRTTLNNMYSSMVRNLEAEPCPSQTVVELTVTAGSKTDVHIFTEWVTARTRRKSQILKDPPDRWSTRCTSGRKGK